MRACPRLRMRHLDGVGITFLYAFLASTTAASESDPLLDEPAEEMIVSGSKTPRSRTTHPHFVTVLEAEDLDSSISTSLDDALRFVPGLQLTREGARGGRAQISLRGLDPNHVVIMIDGVRLNDQINSRGGSFDPTTLALLLIERVEVIRGPLSAVYGSDALAGAINIITRRAGPDDPLEASLTIRGGRFHTGGLIAQASSGLGGVAGISLGAAIDTFRDPNSDGGYDGANFKAKVNAPLPFDIDLESFVRLHWGSARGFPESSGGSELAVLRSMEDRDVREILFGVSLEGPIADFGTLALRASRASRREDLDSPGIDRVPPLDPLGEGDVPPSRAGDQYERWDLALVSTWNLPKLETPVAPFETRVILGADVAWEDGDSGTFLDVSVTGTYEPFPFFDNRRTVGIFCEIEQSIAEHATLSTSLRYDTTPDEDDRFSPAIGLAIEIPRTPVVLFGNYGKGFKRPSFYALGNPLIGDSSLSIEKGRGWEVGLRGHALEGRLRGQISYFEIQVKNLIDFDADDFSLVNQDRLVSRGSETEFGWKPFEWLDLRAGATFNYTNFAGSGGPDPENRPRWFGFGEIAVEPIDTIELNLRVLAVSSVKATSFRTDGRVDKLSGYARIDVRAAWAAFEWLDLFVEIENLTNQTYREAVGFESPGIAPRAGVTIRL